MNGLERKPSSINVLFKSELDGNEISLEATPEFRRIYRLFGGKCFSCSCFNPAVAIHFTKSGRADMFYCFEELREGKRLSEGKKYGGSWWTFKNGEMKEF